MMKIHHWSLGTGTTQVFLLSIFISTTNSIVIRLEDPKPTQSQSSSNIALNLYPEPRTLDLSSRTRPPHYPLVPIQNSKEINVKPSPPHLSPSSLNNRRLHRERKLHFGPEFYDDMNDIQSLGDEIEPARVPITSAESQEPTKVFPNTESEPRQSPYRILSPKVEISLSNPPSFAPGWASIGRARDRDSSGESVTLEKVPFTSPPLSSPSLSQPTKTFFSLKNKSKVTQIPPKVFPKPVEEKGVGEACCGDRTESPPLKILQSWEKFKNRTSPLSSSVPLRRPAFFPLSPQLRVKTPDSEESENKSNKTMPFKGTSSSSPLPTFLHQDSRSPPVALLSSHHSTPTDERQVEWEQNEKSTTEPSPILSPTTRGSYLFNPLPSLYKDPGTKLMNTSQKNLKRIYTPPTATVLGVFLISLLTLATWMSKARDEYFSPIPSRAEPLGPLGPWERSFEERSSGQSYPTFYLSPRAPLVDVKHYSRPQPQLPYTYEFPYPRPFR